MECKNCGTTESKKWYKGGTQCQSCFQKFWQLSRVGFCVSCWVTISPKWYKQLTQCDKCYKRCLQYDTTQEKLAKMSKVCELCGSMDRLCVDHDHRTGRVRGMLCTRCNVSLGSLGDTVESIRGVLAYLERGLR